MTKALKEEREMTLAAELYEMMSQGWTDEEAHRKQEAFFERIGNAAEGLTHAEVWNVWSNAWKYEIDGAPKQTMFAIVPCRWEDVPGDSAPVFYAKSIHDVLDQIYLAKWPDWYTIEEYTANEDGDFLDGSDFDTFDNFTKRFTER